MQRESLLFVERAWGECEISPLTVLKFLHRRADSFCMSQESSTQTEKSAPSPTVVIAGVFLYAVVVCTVFGVLAFR